MWVCEMAGVGCQHWLSSQWRGGQPEPLFRSKEKWFWSDVDITVLCELCIVG